MNPELSMQGVSTLNFILKKEMCAKNLTQRLAYSSG